MIQLKIVSNIIKALGDDLNFEGLLFGWIIFTFTPEGSQKWLPFFILQKMAEVGRVEVTVNEIECPFCGAECDDERTYSYSDIIEYINITCDECEGVFELYICADVDISITEVTPPKKHPKTLTL